MPFFADYIKMGMLLNSGSTVFISKLYTAKKLYFYFCIKNKFKHFGSKYPAYVAVHQAVLVSRAVGGVSDGAGGRAGRRGGDVFKAVYGQSDGGQTAAFFCADTVFDCGFYGGAGDIDLLVELFKHMGGAEDNDRGQASFVREAFVDGYVIF